MTLTARLLMSLSGIPVTLTITFGAPALLFAQSDAASMEDDFEESNQSTTPPQYDNPLVTVLAVDANTGLALFETYDSSEISPQLKNRRKQDHPLRELSPDAFLYRLEADWAFGVSYANYGHFERRTDTLDAGRFERPYELDLHIDNEFRSGKKNDPDEELLRFAPPELRWKIRPRYVSGSAAEWALRYWQGERPMIHYNRAVSGRYGVLQLALVLPEELFDRQRFEIQRAAAGVGFRPGYRAADFDANRDSIAYTNFSTEISQTEWSDERGGLMTIIGWFEYGIEYAIMDIEKALDTRGADLAPMGGAARAHNSQEERHRPAPPQLEPAPEAARKVIHWVALLREYWYVALVPVGVWFLLRRSDKSSQSRTHTPGQDRRL